MNYKHRLSRAIPGGAHTYSRGADQFPSNAPPILARGQGAYVWDAEGNRLLDYGMALRAVTLGYAHPDVNAAAAQAMSDGNNLTRASLVELEAAELLIDLLPSADMVKFAKNGSNATTAAIKIARAYTGRRYVCIPRQQPFFSFDDWFIGTTVMKRGVDKFASAGTLLFDYNDEQSLQELFDRFRGQIAAVMLEPATTLVPCNSSCNQPLQSNTRCASCPHVQGNFLHKVQDIARSNGALFILDEMITGFRWHLQGAQHYFGVQPDISTFGKGMANGFSVSAVAGRRDVMEVGSIETAGAERTFLLSTTHGGEMSSLAAFIATIAVYRKREVCEHLWQYGTQLAEGMKNMARELALDEHFQIEGPAICLTYLTKNRSGDACAKMRTLFNQELIRNGVLMPWISVSLAHDERAFDLTMGAVRSALEVYSKALVEGPETYLQGPQTAPVFRRYN